MGDVFPRNIGQIIISAACIPSEFIDEKKQ